MSSVGYPGDFDYFVEPIPEDLYFEDDEDGDDGGLFFNQHSHHINIDLERGYEDEEDYYHPFEGGYHARSFSDYDSSPRARREFYFDDGDGASNSSGASLPGGWDDDIRHVGGVHGFDQSDFEFFNDDENVSESDFVANESDFEPDGEDFDVEDDLDFDVENDDIPVEADEIDVQEDEIASDQLEEVDDIFGVGNSVSEDGGDEYVDNYNGEFGYEEDDFYGSWDPLWDEYFYEYNIGFNHWGDSYEDYYDSPVFNIRRSTNSQFSNNMYTPNTQGIDPLSLLAPSVNLNFDEAEQASPSGSRACVICSDRKSACRFEPCNHDEFCVHCALNLNKMECPLCRSEILRISNKER